MDNQLEKISDEIYGRLTSMASFAQTKARRTCWMVFYMGVNLICKFVEMSRAVLRSTRIWFLYNDKKDGNLILLRGFLKVRFRFKENVIFKEGRLVICLFILHSFCKSEDCKKR